MTERSRLKAFVVEVMNTYVQLLIDELREEKNPGQSSLEGLKGVEDGRHSDLQGEGEENEVRVDGREEEGNNGDGVSGDGVWEVEGVRLRGYLGCLDGSQCRSKIQRSGMTPESSSDGKKLEMASVKIKLKKGR